MSSPSWPWCSAIAECSRICNKAGMHSHFSSFGPEAANATATIAIAIGSVEELCLLDNNNQFAIIRCGINQVNDSTHF